MQMAGLVSPIFCASNLMRKRSVQSRLRRQLRKAFAEDCFEVDFEDHSADSKRQLKAVLALAEKPPTQDKALNGHQKRLKALQRLSANAAGQPRCSTVLVHPCRFGCHDSKEAACKEMLDDVVEVWPNHPPQIIALNKWTKILPPLAWFASFACFFRLLPRALRWLEID